MYARVYYNLLSHDVHVKNDSSAGCNEMPLVGVRDRKRQRFGHTTRRPGSLARAGLMDGARGRGRPTGTCLTDITEWTVIAIKQV